MRVAGASRSLEPVASTSTQSSTDAPSSGQAVARSTSATPTSNSPLRKPSALNTSRVATGTRGLTITQGSFGRAAADAGRDRQHLIEGEIAKLEIGHAFAKQFRCLEHQVVGGLAAVLRQRPGGSEIELGSGRQAEPVGAIGERNHAFEIVIAIDPASNHPKGQVDLGTRIFG